MHFNKLVFPVVVILLCSCHSNSSKHLSDSLKKDSALYPPKGNPTKITSAIPKPKPASFQERIYLEIKKIYSGDVYINNKGDDVFYRVLEIPEEENIMLIAENISTGDEGGNYQLIKRINLNDVLAKYGSLTVDSLKFIDSVTFEGYFNDKKMVVNLDKLKQYPSEGW